MAKQLDTVSAPSTTNQHKLKEQIPAAARTAPFLTLQNKVAAREQPRSFKGQRQHCITIRHDIRLYGKIVYSATDKSRSKETLGRIC